MNRDVFDVFFGRIIKLLVEDICAKNPGFIFKSESAGGVYAGNIDK